MADKKHSRRAASTSGRMRLKGMLRTTGEDGVYFTTEAVRKTIAVSGENMQDINLNKWYSE